MGGLLSTGDEESYSKLTKTTMETPPSAWQEFKDTTLSSFNSTNLALSLALNYDEDNANHYQKKLENQINAIQEQSSIPGGGWSNSIANFVGTATGFSVNPINIAAGAATGGLADAALGAASDIGINAVGSKLSSEAAEKLISPGARKATQLIKNAGEGAAQGGLTFGLPQGIAENYNAQSNDIDWSGVGKTMAGSGAIGAFFGSIPAAAGIVAGKIKNAQGSKLSAYEKVDKQVSNDELDQAKDNNVINKQEHELFSKYKKTKKKSEQDVFDALYHDLNDLANSINEENGMNPDYADNKVPLTFVKSQDTHNLNKMEAAKYVNNMDDSSNYHANKAIGDNYLNELYQDSTKQHAMNGVRSHIQDQLESENEKMNQWRQGFREQLKKTNIKDNAIDQSDLLKHLENSNLKESEINHVKQAVPDNVKKIFRLRKERQRLYNKKSRRRKKGEDISHIDKKIDSINKDMPSLKSLPSELDAMEKKFLDQPWSEKELYNDTDLQRLRELSHIHPAANTLYEGIRRKREYAKARGLKNVIEPQLHAVNSLSPVESDIGELSNFVNKVHEEPKSYSTPHLKNNINEQKNTISTDDQAIQDMESQANDILKDINPDAEVAEDYRSVSNKLKEIKEKPKVFDNLSKCIKGAMRG